MKVHNVSYDLRRAGQDYAGLIEELKKSPSWWHHLGSTWLIATTETALQLWNRVAPHLDKNDSMLIIEVGDDYSGWFPQEAWDWIKEHIPVRFR